MTMPNEGRGGCTSLTGVLQDAVARTTAKQESRTDFQHNLSHARSLTLLLMARLEKEIQTGVAEREGGEWLWGKENAASTLVKLTASLLKIIELESVLDKPESKKNTSPQEVSTAELPLLEEDRNIIVRYLERQRAQQDAILPVAE